MTASNLGPVWGLGLELLLERWTAHRKCEAVHIPCVVTETKSDAELPELAIRRNASHGLQLSQKDKKNMARTIYHVTPEKSFFHDQT